jgi:hypothetical protein
VYNVLSDDDANVVVNTLRSVTCNVVVGNFPSTIPATVVTPMTVIVVDPTLTTCAKTGSVSEVSLYEIKSFFLTKFPGNKLLGLVIVLTPESVEIVAIPTLNFEDCTVSAENVDAVPTRL